MAQAQGLQLAGWSTRRLALVLLGVGLALVLLALPRGRAVGEIAPTSSGEEDARAWVAYSDPVDRFSLRYPEGWRAIEVEGGVRVERADGGAIALQVLLPDGLAVSPGAIDESLARAETIRRAENVAVGGWSGEETIATLPAGDSLLGRLGASARSALSSSAPALTIVTWKGETAGRVRWVILTDEADGANLPELELMRSSLRWE